MWKEPGKGPLLVSALVGSVAVATGWPVAGLSSARARSAVTMAGVVSVMVARNVACRPLRVWVRRKSLTLAFHPGCLADWRVNRKGCSSSEGTPGQQLCRIAG